MPEEQSTPVTEVVKKPTRGPNRFELGHQRFGGRKKTLTGEVRALAEELDADPLAWMLGLIKDGFVTQVVMENGKRKRVEVTASLEMRADLAKHVSKFMYPTLTATQVSGASGGPIEVATMDLMKLMENPSTARLAEDLALQLAQPPAVEEPRFLPAPEHE